MEMDTPWWCVTVTPEGAIQARDSSSLHASLAESEGTTAAALSARALQQRLRTRPQGVLRLRGGAIFCGHHSSERALATGARALHEPRSFGAGLRVFVGGRHPHQREARLRRSIVLPGRSRSEARWHEGVGGPCRWLAGIGRKLGRVAEGPQKAWHESTGAGGRGRGVGGLERAEGRISGGPLPERLCS